MEALLNHRAAYRIAAAVVAIMVGLTPGAWAANGDSTLAPENLPPAWRAPLGEQPRLVIELHDETVDIAISGDGRWLVASRDDDTLLLGKLFGYWSFECVAAISGMVLLLAFWLLRRVSLQARVVGEPYCRKCNYRLTGLSSSQCPECGTDLNRRRPVIGKPPWRMRGFVAIVSVTALTVITFTALNRSTLRLVVEEALANWHSRWIFSLREQWPQEWRQWCGVLDIYDTADGRLNRTIEVGLQEGSTGMTPSRDGRYIYHSLGNAPITVARHDLSNDAITVIYDAPADGYVGRIVGVAEDGEVFINADEHYFVDPMTGRRGITLGKNEHEYIFSRCLSRRALIDFDEDLKDHLYVLDMRTGKTVADFHEDAWPQVNDVNIGLKPDILLDVNAIYCWRNQSVLTDPKPTVERREYATTAVSVSMPLPSAALEGEDHSDIKDIALVVPDGRYVLVLQSHNLPEWKAPQHTVVGVWDLMAGKYIHRFDGPFTFGSEPMHISRDGRTLVVAGKSPDTGSPIVCYLYNITKWAEPMSGRDVKAAVPQ